MADKFIRPKTKAEQQQAKEVTKQAAIDAVNKAKKEIANTGAHAPPGVNKGAMGRPVGSQMPLHLANKQSQKETKRHWLDVEDTVKLAAGAIRSAAQNRRTKATKPLRAPGG